MKLKDIDGDGIVNAKDLSVIGNANPKHTGGMVINANAYGFDFSAAFKARLRSSIKSSGSSSPIDKRTVPGPMPEALSVSSSTRK